MSAGIDSKYDIIYSVEGTEWHGQARHVEKIEEKGIEPILFDIIESPVFVQVDGNSVNLENYKVLCADYRGIRDDLQPGEQILPLHIPKAGYKVITNRGVWDLMNESLKEVGATVTSVGTLEAGKKFFISTNIGDNEMVINRDQFKFHLNFIASHDSTMSVMAYDSSVRIVCMNTLRSSLGAAGDVDFRVMHTKNADLGMKNLPLLIQSILNGRLKLKEVMEYLETCKVDSNDAIAMAAGYFARNAETNDLKLSTRSLNAANEIGVLFSRGIGCKGETLYDLLNAATEYWTSGAGTGKKNVDRGVRVYRSSIGVAADHKTAFSDMLFSEKSRDEALLIGREALKLAAKN